MIKDGTYVTSLDDKQSKGIHSVSLFIDRNTAAYLGSFGIEYVPQEVTNKIKDKSITYNIFRIQSDVSIMCGFYCIAFIEYMIADKTLLNYTSSFSPNYYNKKTMTKEFISTLKTDMTSLDFRLKKIDETRNFFLEEIKHN